MTQPSRPDHYRARPPGAGPWPGVVVLHELFGVNDVLRRQADRLAAAGYLTLAPDLFGTGGGLTKLRCVAATMTSLARGSGAAFDDIKDARTELAADPSCTGKVGVIGFCLGGGFALAVAAHGFDAVAANYGQLPHKLERTLTGACPIVASYGGKDRLIPAKRSTRRLESTLTKLGIDHDVKVYPEAGHSFLNDAEVGPVPLRPIMRIANVGPAPESSPDAWARIEAFFDLHLSKISS